MTDSHGLEPTADAERVADSATPSGVEAPWCDLGEDECLPGYYEHPLQGLEPIDGQLPFFDVHERPDQGIAYAIGEGGGQLGEDDPQSHFGGVVEVGYEPVSDETFNFLMEGKGPEVPQLPDAPTIDPAVQAEVDAVEPGAMIDGLFIEVHKPTSITGSVTDMFERAIAEGQVFTHADAQEVRAQLIAERIALYEDHVGPVANAVESLGGNVDSTCKIAPCLMASVPAEAIGALAAHPLVERIDFGPSDPVGGTLDGEARAEAYDTQLFWDKPLVCGGSTRSFDGDRGCTQNIHVAVADAEEFLLDHVGFQSNASSSSSRIKEAWECEPICTDIVDFSNAGDHGTQTLGALLQDYRDGQQSGLTTTQERERSATAGEAKAYVYDYNGAGYGNALGNIVTRSPIPAMILESQGEDDVNNNLTCLGEDPEDELVNTIYELGIGYFLLAGNHGGSSTNCRIWDPAAAIGAFTVGAYDPISGSACSVESSDAHNLTSWGGATSGTGFLAEGKGRSIVDISGSWRHFDIANSSSTTSIGGYTGTSAATPTVGSVAIGVIDMFKTHVGTNFIDNPGVLYAWMLNMGDRANGSTTKLTSRFDHRLGAGRMTARFLSAEGMDSPWYYYHYSLCIADGGSYTINLNNGNALPSDVDALRAVAWWYDERHADGTPIDDIDLILRDANTNALLGWSNDPYDNKERVFSSYVGGREVELEVIGSDVTSDVAGCGTNRMRVYVTILAEDSDRDDANGPSYNATTCEGVNTL